MPLPTKIRTDLLPRYQGNGLDHLDGLVDLATNENRLGPSELSLQAYAAAAKDLFRYPDSAQRKLKAALAERFAVPAGKLACGAGSDELISLLMRLFAGPGDEVLFPGYSFIMFSRYALRTGASPIAARTDGYRLSVDGILEGITARTAIVFVANPNNPTGACLTKSEICRLRSGMPAHIPLVLDSAYAEYTDDPDYSDGSDLAEEFQNVIVLRTFSKLYGLAALRIGWCIAPAPLIDKIDRLRGPYNVSAPAQMAAIQALADLDHADASRRHNTLWRARLIDELSQAGLRAEPSGGNFLNVVFRDLQSADCAYRGLLEEGILTRPLHDYDMPECIRITVGRESDNQRIVEFFRQFAEAAPVHKKIFD